MKLHLQDMSQERYKIAVGRYNSLFAIYKAEIMRPKNCIDKI